MARGDEEVAAQHAEQQAMMARHVLFAYSAGPIEQRVRAGSFTVALIDLIGRADAHNRARLSLGFPGYVRLVHAIQNYPESVDQIVKIAETGVWDLTFPPPSDPRSTDGD